MTGPMGSVEDWEVIIVIPAVFKYRRQGRLGTDGFAFLLTNFIVNVMVVLKTKSGMNEGWFTNVRRDINHSR